MIGTGSSEKDNRMFKICPKFVLYVLPALWALSTQRDNGTVAWVKIYKGSDLKYRQRLEQGAEPAWRRNTGGFRTLRRAN